MTVFAVYDCVCCHSLTVCVFCYKRVPCCNFVLTVTGECLQEAGEVFKQLADHKYALEDNVKQNFLGPLADLQSKDLKEVNVGHSHIRHWRKLDVHSCLMMQIRVLRTMKRIVKNNFMI